MSLGYSRLLYFTDSSIGDSPLKMSLTFSFNLWFNLTPSINLNLYFFYV